MTLHGHFENGVVVVDEPNSAPDGTKVMLQFEVSSDSVGIHPEVLRVSGIFPLGTSDRAAYHEAQALKHK